MQAYAFDEEGFYGAIAASGARALLIGRQALIALGLPVVTGDYDFWLHIDDIAIFNQALAPLGFHPNRSPEEARRAGRYVLENDERADVLVARAQPTVDGVRINFDDVWSRRTTHATRAASIAMPTIDDLIATKQFGARPKDAEDIRLLRALQKKVSP